MANVKYININYPKLIIYGLVSETANYFNVNIPTI